MIKRGSLHLQHHYSKSYISREFKIPKIDWEFSKKRPTPLINFYSRVIKYFFTSNWSARLVHRLSRTRNHARRVKFWKIARSFERRTHTHASFFFLNSFALFRSFTLSHSRSHIFAFRPVFRFAVSHRCTHFVVAELAEISTRSVVSSHSFSFPNP